MSSANLALVVLVGLFVIVSWARLAALLRVRALQRAAMGMQWKFHPNADGILREGADKLALFRQGRGRARHLVTDGRIALFDYTWESFPGALQPKSVAQLVAIAKTPNACAFRLESRRPGEFGMHEGYEAAHEVDLDTLNDRYRLLTHDGRSLVEVFTDKTVEFFREHPTWCVECDGSWLVAWQVGIELDASRLSAQTHEVAQIVAMFSVSVSAAHGSPGDTNVTED
jgi:hypothetical protein